MPRAKNSLFRFSLGEHVQCAAHAYVVQERRLTETLSRTYIEYRLAQLHDISESMSSLLWVDEPDVEKGSDA